MNQLNKLENIRKQVGTPLATGLGDNVIKTFLSHDEKLAQAIDWAEQNFIQLSSGDLAILKNSEAEAIKIIQNDYINFYSAPTIQPFIALSAFGPWIVSAYGRIIYDSGGYGMLGSGHNPPFILQAMSKPYAMANIMTPNLAQKHFTDAMRKELGFTRALDKREPFKKFLCLNSGSESMTVALRLSDVNAKNELQKNAIYTQKKTKFIVAKRSFHGRTEGPAQISDSSLEAYQKHLHSFYQLDNLIVVEPNNTEQLRVAYAQALAAGYFVEAVVMEPVMGEGEPGKGLTPEFYQLARKLTVEHGALFIVDSIQAALRAHGCLSIVDYPGFRDLDPPDIESYSKAINGGQYPLSVLALSERAASLYRIGVYGNTMTTNPRALEVAVALLNSLNPELRNNIVAKGKELIEKLHQLNNELGRIITKIEGTGLLLAAHFDPNHFKVVGENSLEMNMRKRGVNIIHGGKNALRFTPHFSINSQEINLIMQVLREVITSYRL